MSTPCLISIREKDRIDTIECWHDGYIHYVGVLLHLFYTDVEKVRRLIKGGLISSLGISESEPKIVFDSRENMDICFFVNNEFKTSFTRHSPDFVSHKTFQSIEDLMEEWGNGFSYLFDVNENKWFVTALNTRRSRERKVYLFDLDRILKYKTHIRNLYKAYGYNREEEAAEDEFSNIKENMIYFKDTMRQKDIDVCNTWVKLVLNDELLNWRGRNSGVILDRRKIRGLGRIEFGYSESQTHGKFYALFEALKQGQSKRTSLIRSKDLNELVLFVCETYGLNPYARPIFGNKSVLV